MKFRYCSSSFNLKAFKVTRQQSVSEVVMLTSPLTAFERQLYYMTAQHHYNTGCPDLSLQVLLDLPPPENDSVLVGFCLVQMVCLLDSLEHV